MVVVGGVLYLIGMLPWPLLFATVLVSAGLSFFVLSRQREAAARSLEASVAARSTRRRVRGPKTPTTDPDGAPEPPSRGAGPAQGEGQSSMQGET